MDPAQGPWAVCDRCGLWYSHADLTWQYDFRGGSVPQARNLLVCRRTCLDDLNYNNMLLILPPDPPPQFNIRPEFFEVDEANWLRTESDDVITTQTGVYIETSIPNPQDNAATAHLLSSILAPGGSVATAYLDIFYGDPSAGGISVLAQITGSATRTNIASQLTTVLGVAENADTIIVALESGATVNSNWVGIYSAATSGTLLMSGQCAVRGQFVTVGNPVVFDALDLQIDLNL